VVWLNGASNKVDRGRRTNAIKRAARPLHFAGA
jgi:hypothetical protein